MLLLVNYCKHVKLDTKQYFNIKVTEDTDNFFKILNSINSNYISVHYK